MFVFGLRMIRYTKVLKRGTPGFLGMLVCGLTVLMSLPCETAFGAYITMATDFSISGTSDGSMLSVTTENRGDVSAHDVQFEVVIADTTLIGPVRELLHAGEKTSAQFPLQDMSGIQGRYPVVIRTYYKDANDHRFTALTAGYYEYQSSFKTDVSIEGGATDVPVDGKGTLKFKIRNDGQEDRKLNLVLFLPDELSVTHDKSVIGIGSHQETTVQYDIRNYSALADSSYQVYVVGWYESAGRRSGIIGSAVVRITKDGESAGQPVWIWALLGGFLPGVIIFLRLQHRRTLSSARA